MTDRLAIEGGTPIRKSPMPAWPSPSEAQIAAVTDVLRTGRINYWTGEVGRSLEREYAEYLGCKHALLAANGTLALELALRGLRIGRGDEVVVPARTFIATASCIVTVGATPVVADIDPDSGNLTAATVSAALSERTKAVVVVHLGGWPAEMDDLLALARERGLKVVEDCAQAHGGTYRGRLLGSLGDVACFSFCQDKIIAAGEGGLVACNDDEVAERIWSYRDHGKSYTKYHDPEFMARKASFKWVHDSFGSNHRMAELESAMARVGLAELPAAHARRTELALRLAAGLEPLRGIRAPLPPTGSEHAFYRLYAYVRPDELAGGWGRDRVLFAIAAEGVPVQYGSCAELYREDAMRKAGFGPDGRLPGAALVHDTSLAFFVHPTLADTDIDDVIAAVAKVMEAATS